MSSLAEPAGRAALASGPPDSRELLRRKRDGETLDAAAIGAWVRGVVDGSVGDGQIGAFAMAVRLRDMNAAETLALTLAMRDSGDRLEWSAMALDGPVLDKHSTGGVGDLTSLVLAPLLAACGGYLPMLSGHGLGHTGGTLDKLESLPGLGTRLDTPQLMRVVRDAGLAMVAAGAGLAPADARLYAVRDLTSTVDSLPLITASILSKKLAVGSDALLLDVKCGGGACFADDAMAFRLADALVDTATAAGLPTAALITDMSQPLVADIGNALELRVAMDYLSGRRSPPRLHALCLLLGAPLLCRGGLAASKAQAREQLMAALASGAGAERLARMINLQGGPVDAFERVDAYLPSAPVQRPLRAQRDGWISAIDTRALGLAVVALGGGRLAPGDAIDPRVGLAAVRNLGQQVAANEPLLHIHAADHAAAERIEAALSGAFTLSEQARPAPALLRGCRTAQGWQTA